MGLIPLGGYGSIELNVAWGSKSTLLQWLVQGVFLALGLLGLLILRCLFGW